MTSVANNFSYFKTVDYITVLMKEDPLMWSKNHRHLVGSVSQFAQNRIRERTL